MSDQSPSEHGADNAGAERATSLPAPPFAAAEITGGIETLTLNDTTNERLIRIIASLVASGQQGCEGGVRTPRSDHQV
jgi:hypothetical protein